eukprot:UN29258
MNVTKHDVSIPDSVDWRNKNAVTPIKNQEQCGSSPYFGGVTSLEGAYAIAKGKLISLSVQQIIDCSRSYGNSGCNGGYPQWEFDYIIANGGIDSDEDYPYKGQNGDCDHEKEKHVVETMSSYIKIDGTTSKKYECAILLNRLPKPPLRMLSMLRVGNFKCIKVEYLKLKIVIIQ